MSMIGKTLAHYEITSQLGKGGMGEVYRAKDRKLGRDVAVKVLPEEFARDADRVARFQREAKLLASLNHPNIAAIHGLEESGGTNFLILELVEGETLADQIKRGPIPVEESLKLALQIAEALEAAHEKGVIHRDLKPANIKVTPDGKVKVLDFGLAKAFAGEQSDLNLSNSPTLTRSPTLSDMATQQGVILGTAAYMSPEQAKGKTVDKRADIWAFGAVLFEMLTGQAAFQGEDVTEILASVVKGGANLDLLPVNLHPRVREVIIRCLQKDLRRRYSGITDARYEIEQALADPGGVLAQPQTLAERQSKWRLVLPWVTAAVVVAAIIVGLTVWKLKPIPPPEPHQVTRFFYELPKDQQLSGIMERAIAISPDGRQFVYGTPAGLYLRSMEEMDAKLLPNTAGILQRPFFSPDGKWIGFFSSTDNKLKKLAISGGVPLPLADVSPSGSFDWNEDDTIVYGQMGKGIMRISAKGGTPVQIVKPAENELYLIHPQILPDGKSIMFMRLTSTPNMIVQSLKSGERKELFEGNAARYLPTGHIIYASGNNLNVIRFDLNALKVIGGPVPVVEGMSTLSVAPQYTVSDSGTLVYITSAVSGTTASNQRTLVWVDRKGKEQPLAAQPNDYRNPHISPDGTKLALGINAGNKSDIWIWDIVRETMTRLTFNEASADPLWTLDGKRVAFMTGSNLSDYAVCWKAANGAGGDEKLASGEGRAIVPWSWSKDEKILVTMEYTGPNPDIGSLSMEGDHKSRPLLQQKYNEIQPQISPDGRWMAHASDESGKMEIYVRPFPEVDKGRWQISTSGGLYPLWSPGGRELFYRNGDSVMAVAVETEPSFKPGKAEVLFQGKYDSEWDISPGGKSFLMLKQAAQTVKPAESLRKINIALNWFEELKQRVPSKLRSD
jgi:serine/threonine protein kinase/Tol biopolymer transport system component